MFPSEYTTYKVGPYRLTYNPGLGEYWVLYVNGSAIRHFQQVNIAENYIGRKFER